MYVTGQQCLSGVLNASTQGLSVGRCPEDHTASAGMPSFQTALLSRGTPAHLPLHMTEDHLI